MASPELIADDQAELTFGRRRLERDGHRLSRQSWNPGLLDLQLAE